MIVFGALLLLVGLAAYTGRLRWVIMRSARSQAWFGLTWLGLGLVLAHVATALGEGRDAPQAVLAVLSGALILFGIVTSFWMPAVLLPEWYRTWKVQRDNGSWPPPPPWATLHAPG